MPASEKIVHLRQLLAERLGPPTSGDAESFITGLAALDDIGIPTASLTEIVSAPATGPGGNLLLYALLHAVLQKGQRVILIDGKNAFAPNGLPPTELSRLLWTRCREAWEAIKAADLAVRDGNVPLVVMLLTLNAAPELRRLPANAWHRLQMLCEKSAVTLLAFTPLAHEPLLEIEGHLQNLEGVISVLAQRVREIRAPATIHSQSYDFH